MKNKRYGFWACCLVLVLCVGFAGGVHALPSTCEKCHTLVTPGIVKDFNSGKMSESLTCDVCHGDKHTDASNADMAVLPTITTCRECHPEQAEQYLGGKHAHGLEAVMLFSNFAHKQPKAFIGGQKGCNGCHNLGITDQNVRKSDLRKYYKYGMDCQNCHTRHKFLKKEAQRPEACNSCHTGFDHAQWEMWYHSKHGSAYMIDKTAHRGPTCQDCHMSKGNHRVMTAWGFLAVRLPEKDPEWMGYRMTFLKALGVFDKDGNPTQRLDAFKAVDMGRLTEAAWEKERKDMIAICRKCHSANFAKENLKNADLMIKAADQIFAQAIDIVAGLYRDGLIKETYNQATFPYPDLYNLYEVNTHIEELLYEMFMDYRMKTYQAAFHMMPDYTTWYGYGRMKETLVEMQAIDRQMRGNAGVSE